MSNTRRNPLTVVAWAVVIFTLLVAGEVLVVQLLWNAITAPLIDATHVSFRTGLAMMLTVGIAGRLMTLAARALGAIKA